MSNSLLIRDKQAIRMLSRHHLCYLRTRKPSGLLKLHFVYLLQERKEKEKAEKKLKIKTKPGDNIWLKPT